MMNVTWEPPSPLPCVKVLFAKTNLEDKQYLELEGMIRILLTESCLLLTIRSN